MNESLDHHGAGMNISNLLTMSGDRVAYVNNEAAGVLLGGVALGALGLQLLLYGLLCKRLDIREVTVFKASLILSCILQAVSTPVVAMMVLGSICQLEYCGKLLLMWLVYRRCVVLLHLLVALEFILTDQSRGSTKRVPPYLSVTVVLMINFLCIIFYDVLEAVATVGVMALALTLWVLKARCFATSNEKPLNQVLCLAFVSFAGTYFPSFVLECMILNENFVSAYLYDILLCSTNLCLVTSAYLCWITCRRTHEEDPQIIEISSHHPPQTRF